MRDGINGVGKKLDEDVVIKSQSTLYKTPRDVFALLMEKAHLADIIEEDPKGGDSVSKSGQERIDYGQMVDELLRGAEDDIPEMLRFNKLVLIVGAHIHELMYDYRRASEGDSVRAIVTGMRNAEALDGVVGPASAMGLFLTSEDFLNGVSRVEEDGEGEMDTKWISERVSGFAYAIEKKIYTLTGDPL